VGRALEVHHMGNLKSQDQKLILDLFENLFLDLQQRYPGLSKSFQADFLTLVSRVEWEGLSFVTKTLPKLGKSFDEALDSGVLVPPRAFKKAKGSQTIPAFMQGMFSMLFDGRGFLVEEPNADIIRDIRQVLFLVYKYEIPFDPKDCTRVIGAFLETEDELSELDLSSQDLSGERDFVCEILSDFDPKDIVPRHGPGAVATGEKLEQKWVFSRLYSAIHQVYPYYEFFIAGGAREVLDRVKWYRALQREISGEAKVVLVPKDSRGPRLISCEPLEYQWIQQGLGRKLMSHLEKHKLTRGRINFIDQSINRDLARDSSRHQQYCTIDLKDASDRVSLEAVKMIFPDHVYICLAATRSTSTKLPDGRQITLKKFAPMGSALCFPVEAFIFWAICVVAVARQLHVPYRDAAPNVYVYGDDIIVPTACYDSVVSALERIGLRVNTAKCCSKGNFRESCGMDAYNGVDVTPTRISTRWSKESSSGSCLASYSAYANQFAEKGYDRLARAVWKHVERVHGALPYGLPSSGFPCRHANSRTEAHLLNTEAGFKVRMNREYQRLEYKVRVLVPYRRRTRLKDWPRLLRNSVSGPIERPDEVVHPRSTVIRTAWRAL
jgi:hypothetical protein